MSVKSGSETTASGWNIPTDTLVDKFAREEGLPSDAALIVKCLYLEFDQLRACAAAHDWTSTQLIDAAETARRKGWIEITYFERQDQFKLALTELGRREWNALHV